MVPLFFVRRPDRIYDIAGRLSQEELTAVLTPPAYENPFIILEWIEKARRDNLLGYPYDGRILIEKGATNQQKIKLAPKLLRNLFHRFLATSNEKIKAGLIQEGVQLYRHIDAIIGEGLEGIVLSILSQQNLSVKQEAELLNVFYGYAIIKRRQKDIFEDLESDLDKLSLKEAKRLLFKIIDKKLNRQTETTDEEIQRFIGVMETPAPFLIYLASHTNSEEHVALLGDIYESLIKGNFRQWKYVGDDEATLSELKAAGLLPEKLTLAQYDQWQQDEQTTLYDTLSADSGDIARHIGQYLHNNIDHLAISHIIKQAAGTDHPSSFGTLLQGIQESIRKTGQTAQDINIRLKTARAENNPDLINLYEKQKKDLELERQELNRARSLIRLMNLSSEEISSGTLLDGGIQKQRGEVLVKLLVNSSRWSTSSACGKNIYLSG